MTKEFTHFDQQGHSRMVDVSAKTPSLRMARARAFLRMKPETLQKIKNMPLPKGDPFEVSRIAGIMAAKRTSSLIPMCHPLFLTHVDVRIQLKESGIEIVSEARCNGETGVEMEALVAATVAGLSLYDMCKSVDKSMQLEDIRLLEKHGGKSGSYVAEDK